MLSSCYKLTSLDLRNFNTSSLTSIAYMFNRCYVLTSLDLSNFDTSSITRMHYYEYGLTHCVKSVHDVDLQRYEDFKAKYDPNFSFDKKGGAGSNKIQWPDENSRGGNKPSNDDDLDLYS